MAGWTLINKNLVFSYDKTKESTRDIGEKGNNMKKVIICLTKGKW